MQFINPNFLFFIPLVLAPFIIHFLFFKKRKKELFSSLFLMEKVYLKKRRLTRFKKALIFLLRVLAALALILAFSKPVVRTNQFISKISGGAAGEENIKLVILIDRSYSMRYLSSGKTRYDAVKDAVVKILESLGKNDKAAALFFSDVPETDHISWSNDIKSLENIINASSPGFKGTDYISALSKAYKFLSKEAGDKKVILIAGDLARHGFKDSSGKLENIPFYNRDTILLGFDFGGQKANAFIKSVSLSGKSNNERFADGLPALSLMAEIAGEPRESGGKKITLSNKSFKETRMFDSRKSGGRLIKLQLPDDAKSLCGDISLDEDNLSVDDKFFYAFKKPFRGLKTLLLYSHPSQLKAGYSAYFLKNLFKDSSFINFKLADANKMEQIEIKEYQALILAGQINNLLINNAVKDFVAGGGKLLIIPSSLDKKGFSAFARNYGIKTLERKKGRYGLFPDFKRAFFTKNNFRGFELDKIEAKEFIETESEAENVLWHFIGASGKKYPALIYEKRGRGALAFYASSFDANWSNIALKPVFADFVFSIINLFSDGSIDGKNKNMVYSGEAFRFDFGDARADKMNPVRDNGRFAALAGGIEPPVVSRESNSRRERGFFSNGVKISGPGNKTYFAYPRKGVLTFKQTEFPGNYHWSLPNGESGCFAVNADRGGGESLLSFAENLPVKKIGFSDTLSDFKAAVYGVQFWRLLLLICVLCFISEGLLSERL